MFTGFFYLNVCIYVGNVIGAGWGFYLNRLLVKKQLNSGLAKTDRKMVTRIKSTIKKDTMKPALPFRLLLLLIALYWQSAVHAASLNGRPLQTLAFGSCNHAHLPQPLWKLIESRNP